MYSEFEIKRRKIQKSLDSNKTKYERNKLGQFSTPTSLAIDIITFAKKLIPSTRSIRFLDPAFGTGSLYSALLNIFPKRKIAKAVGIEIDPHYANPAKELWKYFNIEIKIEDFTKLKEPDEINGFDLVICNPPYVRHHHIDCKDKERLKRFLETQLDLIPSGLSGLYCYFMLLAHRYLTKDAICGWIVPSEFMDVKYGDILKQYLLNRVQLLHIHRYDPGEAQFDEALVSSAIVWFKNKKPSTFKVPFSYGGTLCKPDLIREISYDVLRNEGKWSRFPVHKSREPNKGLKLSELFTIKRGIVTGANNFFILTRTQIQKYDLPTVFLRPILPSSRYLSQKVIGGDTNGFPLIDKPLYLLDCRLHEREIERNYPGLWAYLLKGIRNGINLKYSCKKRNPWYSQERRDPPLFVSTYMGRGTQTNGGRPFRFFLNNSIATATNSYYLLYPKPLINTQIKQRPELKRQILWGLNKIPTNALIEEGRIYGGGMYKIEPKEMGNVSAKEVMHVLLPSILPRS